MLLKRSIAVLVLGALLSGCAPDQASLPAPSTPSERIPAASATPRTDARSPVPISTTVVASDLETPWAVAFTPDGRTFVSERSSGRVLELVDGEGREVYRIEVDPSGEGGLLGLATSPGWERDELLFAYFTSAEGDNRIVRFRLDGRLEPILVGIPSAVVHNGGRLAFGPDGMLYATTGDATQADQAQDPTSLSGKILRMTPAGRPAPGNPFPDSVVYSYGHRNVQGLAWTADGVLYATEFGPDQDDEINRIQPGGNYGWPLVTGQASRDGLVDPEFVVPDTAEASWSGATILRDSAIPQWEGDLFAAALRGQRLYRFVLSPGGGVTDVEQLYVGEFGRLRAAIQAPDGSLWLLTDNRSRGDAQDDDDRVIRLGP